MAKINWFWKCEFSDGGENSIWKMVSASTIYGARKRCFEVGLLNNLTPKYDTLRHATEEEVKEFKKMIKDRIKK